VLRTETNLDLEKEGAEIDIKYSGYLQRQQNQIDQISRQAHRQLPPDLDYSAIDTLSKEARENSPSETANHWSSSSVGGVNQPMSMPCWSIWVANSYLCPSCIVCTSIPQC